MIIYLGSVFRLHLFRKLLHFLYFLLSALFVVVLWRCDKLFIKIALVRRAI